MVDINDEYIKNISNGCFFFEMINKFNKKENSEIDFLLVQFDNISVNGSPINVSVNMSIVASNKNYNVNVMAQQKENYHFIDFSKIRFLL